MLVRFLDTLVPHRSLRWCFFVFVVLLYIARVVSVRGFAIITYGLCIHILYLLVLMLTPLSEPDDFSSEAQLPTSQADGEEFRPFMPRVSEYIVWLGMMKVLLICLCLTLFPFLDIPVFWPLLVFYVIILFVIQIGGRIKHMIKHRYVPWNAGKPKFVPKGSA